MQVSNVDLNLLRTLNVLLSEMNVTRAAEQLNVTQQAMSGSLKRLRLHFNDELLEPVGRHLELTPLAVALKTPLRELMLTVELTLAIKPSFDPLCSTRQFRIALSDYASITFLPLLMPLLARAAPGIGCEFFPIDDAVFHDIEEGKLDFCLLPSNWRLYQNTQPVGLRSLILFEDDFVCAVDHDHPHCGSTMTVAEYAAMSHTIARFSGNIRSLFDHALTVAQLEISVAATARSFTNLLFMVPGTPHVATAQRKLVMAFSAMLPIRMIECPIPIDTLYENLSWHARNELDPAHQFMRELFADAAAKLKLSA